MSQAPKSKKKPRKDEIVAEATRLFAERGYDGTSMGDLAERVGLRKASLFHHFETKDVLYAAVLGNLMADVQAELQKLITMQDGTYVERLDALTDAMTTLFGSQPHAARLLVRELMDWGPLMQDRLGAGSNAAFTMSEEFFKAGQADGTFNPDLNVKHIIISLMGIHFMPFLVDRAIAPFVDPVFSETFREERRAQVRAQIRLLVLKR